MNETETPTQVVAFIAPGQTQEQVRAALDTDPGFVLADDPETAENAAQHVYAAAPQIILVDERVGGMPAIDLIDELALKFPEVAIVALLESDDGAEAQKYLLAGVRVFLVKPFTQVSLLSTLNRVRELEARKRAAHPAAENRPAEGGHPLQTLAVYSPRGGVGCTTLAINLAVAMHERLDVRVLLMEGKMAFGHHGLMLNYRPQNTIADLIPHAGSLDTSLIEEVVSQHASGIHVLLSSPDINVGQGIRPNDLYSVVQAVSRSFDIIVIDAGSHLDDNTVTLMDAADRVLLVTTPELASLHDTSRFIQLMRPLGFPPDKVLTVLNRAGIPGGIKIREIQSVLHQSLFWRISDGDSKVIRSLNRGLPLLHAASRSSVSKDIRAMADELIRLRASTESGAQPAGASPAQFGQNGRERASRPTPALQPVER